MSRAGLGLGLHDALYGSDFLPAFDAFWDYAKRNYLSIQDGKVTGSVTMYYDPLVPCHHPCDASPFFYFGLAHGLLPLYPDDARAVYDTAIDQVSRHGDAPIGPNEPGPEKAGDPMAAMGRLMIQFLAREFGDEAVHAKLKIHSDANDEPRWDTETGEFTWRFGLDEPHPRGQLNASAAFAETAEPGTWANVISRPNLRKFLEPTVHGVDFPKVCLSQAIYDAERRLLAIATDAGAPNAAGEPTTFRITNVDPDRCTVEADGVVSDDWRAVEGDMEVSTTVGEHAFVVRMN